MTLKFLYERYREHIIPSLIILVSFLLFARIILPSIFDVLEARETQKLELDKLANMENKIGLLQDADESILDSRLDLVSSALPIKKDFLAILNAVSSSSEKSGVSISSFKLSVGSLSETEEAEIPTLQVELFVNGSALAVNDFMKILNTTLPISEISNVSASINESLVKINFYYKTLVRSVPDDSLPLFPVSPEGEKVILELSNNYSLPQSSLLDLDSSATSSSTTINPNPFE